jgi:hypothetical protein
MRIDLPTPDAWIKICEKYRAHLPFKESPAVVQVYLGYGHAIWEAIRGLAQLYSNRKTIALIGPSEPVIESIMKEFSAEGFAIKNISLTEATDAAAWLDPIQADVLLTLWVKDDPVTGRLYDHAAVDTLLKDKRIFRLSLLHAQQPISATKPAPFEVWIRSLTPERALLMAGERYRAQPTLAPKMPWISAKDEGAHRFPTEAECAEMQKRVHDFENALPKGFKPYFQKDEARIFDRAVISHPELDGSAVIERLAERINQPLHPLGIDTELEAISQCRWQSTRLSAWLTKRGESEEMIRGAVILSEDVLKTPSLAKHLGDIAEEIRKIQEG